VRRSLILTLGLALGACGGGTTKDFEGPVSSCQSFASAACIRLSQCQSPVDVDNCTTQLENADNCNGASCGGNVFSPVAAQTCYNDTLNQDCADSIANTPVASCSYSLICPSS
jgi:hypothetical protein